MKRDFRSKKRSSRRNEPDNPKSATRWIGGLDRVTEVLNETPQSCRDLWVEHERQSEAITALIRQAKAGGLNVQFMARPEIDRAVQGRHDGVAVRVAYDPQENFAEWLDALPEDRKAGVVVLALDQIQDPQNLGSLARSALQLNAACVIIPERRAASVTPAVVRASAGAALKIPVHNVVNLHQALSRMKERGFWIYGADVEGRAAWDAPLNTPCALVIGSEGYGMRPLIRASCDELLSIPQNSRGVGSLNASCAATVLLYEISRQKNRPNK